MQVRTQEVSAEKAITPTFKLGDEVTFVVGQGTGRTTRFSVRQAKVVQLEDEHAIVQYRNHHCIRLKFIHLALTSEPDPSTNCGARNAP